MFALKWTGLVGGAMGALAAVGVLAVISGCSGQIADEQWVQRNAERQGRIDAVIMRTRAREAESGERIAAVFDQVKANRKRNERNLDRTLGVIDREVRQERAEWPGVWSAARARFADEMAGDPENIKATIPRMFY
jgi:hypothetical protein